MTAASERLPRTWKLYQFAFLAAILAVLLFLSLTLMARTPRAHRNILQVVSVLFFLVVVARYGWGRATESEASGETLRSRRGLALALVVGAGTWATMIPFYFINDDFVHLFAARESLLTGVWRSLTQGLDGSFLRPAGLATIFLEYRLWHDWAPGYHITNLLLHLACATGVFFLCEALETKRETAVLASLIYTVLPIQAEVVSWMGARFDLLAAGFAIWTVVLYVRYRRSGDSIYYGGALIACALAFLSKESAYVLPLLLVSVECFLMSKRRFQPVLGFFLLGILVFGYRWAVLQGIGGYVNPHGQPAAFDIGFKTLEALFVRGPALSLLGYNWLQPSTAILIVLVSLTGAILLALAVGTRPEASGRMRILFSLTWIVLSPLPAHFLLLIGPGLTNSRILYLGSVGIALLTAHLLTGIHPARTRWVATGILVFLLSMGVQHNLGAWRWASALNRELLEELQQLEPSPPPHTEFVFRNLPNDVRGVFFVYAGVLPRFVKMVYDREDVSAHRENELPYRTGAASGERPEIKIDYLGEAGRVIRRIQN